MDKKKRRPDEFEEETEDFKEHFPAIHREITEGNEKLEEEEIRTSSGIKHVRRFRGYTPGVVDFICRCETKEEAIEIIEYLLKKGELSEEYAASLRKQLNEKGLEFFGEHREPGYYERA